MRHMIARKLKEVFLTFCIVTTFVIFATLAYIMVFYGAEEVDVDILWQIPLVAFLCSLGILIHPMREISRRWFRIDVMLHYLYINAVVLGAGSFFEWFELGIPAMTAGMMLLIAALFAVISAIIWTMGIVESRRLNEKLLEYQGRARRGATKAGEG